MENENVEVLEENIDETKETKVEKTFTQTEMDKVLAEKIEQVQSKSREEKAEAERLAKMSEAERQTALLRKEKEQLEADKKEIKEQQMELEITRKLLAKGLDEEYVKCFRRDTIEESIEDIEEFAVKRIKDIAKGVQESLKGGYVPPTSQSMKTEKIDPFLQGFKGK